MAAANSIPVLEGYSLWLRPGQEVRAFLAEFIGDLARQLGSPRFDPHVTLLGGLDGPLEELRSRVAGVARQLRPFSLRTLGLGMGAEPFRALYLAVGTTPPLWQAYVAAHRALAPPKDPLEPLCFQPHLSLAYTTAARTARLAALESRGVPELEFTVPALDLVELSGGPASWRAVASFSLGESSKSQPGAQA